MVKRKYQITLKEATNIAKKEIKRLRLKHIVPKGKVKVIEMSLQYIIMDNREKPWRYVFGYQISKSNNYTLLISLNGSIISNQEGRLMSW